MGISIRVLPSTCFLLSCIANFTHLKNIFINIWFAIQRLNKYILKGVPETRRSPKVSNEMKCTNEKMRWNTQDTNLSWYVPKVNVDHTIRVQETAISTLHHSATTPRAEGANKDKNYFLFYFYSTPLSEMSYGKIWEIFCQYTMSYIYRELH